MTEQNSVRSVATAFRNDLGQWDGSELRIEESYVVSRIEQRTAQRQQTQGRQMLLRYATANGGVWRIEQENSHKGLGYVGRDDFWVREGR